METVPEPQTEIIRLTRKSSDLVKKHRESLKKATGLTLPIAQIANDFIERGAKTMGVK